MFSLYFLTLSMKLQYILAKTEKNGYNFRIEMWKNKYLHMKETF